jgi:hypothetical protein
LKSPAEENEDSPFSKEVVSVLKQIYDSIVDYDTSELNNLPKGSPLLEDFGFSFQAIKESGFEEFLTKCMMLAEADVKELIKVIESQGFDL